MSERNNGHPGEGASQGVGGSTGGGFDGGVVNNGDQMDARQLQLRQLQYQLQQQQLQQQQLQQQQLQQQQLQRLVQNQQQGNIITTSGTQPFHGQQQYSGGVDTARLQPVVSSGAVGSGIEQKRLGGLSQPVMQYDQTHRFSQQQPAMAPNVSHATVVQQAAVIPQLIQQQQQQIQDLSNRGQPVPQEKLQQLSTLMFLQAKNQSYLQHAQPAPQAHDWNQRQNQSFNVPSSSSIPGSSSIASAIASSFRNQDVDYHPAKKQAVDNLDIDSKAKGIALQQMKQLIANGSVSSLNQGQQQTLFKNLFLRARGALRGEPSSTQIERGAMRVSIDKKNRESLDKTFNAEDTTKTDHADEVMRRCEEISKSLRDHLGTGVNNSEGSFGGTRAEAAEAYQQVTQKQLIEACGDTARYLKPYQIVGINFLILLHRTQVGGAILADEMGLGKTAQLITYLGAISTVEKDRGPHLVVVPASLLENWQRELRRWCPSIKSIVYYGKHRFIVRKRLKELRAKLENGEQVDDDLADLQDPDLLAEIAASEKLKEAENRNDDLEEDDSLDLEEDAHDSDDEYDAKYDPDETYVTKKPFQEIPPPKWDMSAPLAPAPFDVMLTSYTLFERDSVDQRADRAFLESWKWSHLIMDEAHALKNREAQRTTRLRRIANLSRRRIMMTGTPLQNDLAELQNLMHFLLPQVFAAESFEDFAEMIQGDEAEVQKLTERMKKLLGPFVLRRLKTEVAGQLTEKKHSTEFIEMTAEQKEMYDASIKSMRSQISTKVSDKIVSDSTQEGVEKFMRSIGAKKINHMFTHLRKIAQHPLLIRHHYDDASVEEIAKKAFEHNLFSGNATLKRVTDELLGYSDFGLHAFCYGAGPDFEGHRLSSIHLLSSTKFRFLADLLPRLKEEGSRPLIFSQWTAVLDVIEWLMEDLMLPYVRLDGSTAVDERLATVDRFNNSDDVFAFLLSTRAGGQGLNLTGADTVILHDVDFNPQIDRQAEDRCHRLGQTKPVMVYRLVTKSSVDQNIYNLSQRKLKLDAAVLDGITTGRGAKQRQNAQERQQMGFILRSLFAGEEDYAEMMEGEKKDNDNLIELSKDAEQEIKKEAEGERGPEDNTVAT